MHKRIRSQITIAAQVASMVAYAAEGIEAVHFNTSGGCHAS